MHLPTSSFVRLLGKFGLLMGACFILYVCAFPNQTVAQIQSGVLDTQVNAAGSATGLDGSTDIRIMIATIVQVSLGLLGTIFLVLIVMASYWFIIARGREDYVQKAKITMVRGTVGMIIILISYSITTFLKNTIEYVAR
jgi:uncharacterized membrane protein YwzB